MRTHEIQNFTTPLEALSIQDVTAGSVGEIIDTRDATSTLFTVLSATLTTGTWAVTLDEGNNSALSDASTVATADIVGSLSAYTASEDNTAKSFAYIGDKRYVRMTLTATGPSGTNNFGAIATNVKKLNEPA